MMFTADTLEGAWNDFLAALDFAEERFNQWHHQRAIGTGQAQAIAQYYRQWRDELARARQEGQSPPDKLGLAPPSDVPATVQPIIRQLRYWRFVGNEIKRHETQGRLALSEAHACLIEVRERVAALSRRLDLESVPEVLPGDEPAPTAPPRRPPRPRRPLLEILLDPRNIQWLLVFGAVLLVLGLVIFLYAAGIFENPVVVAGLMSAGTVGLLVVGWAVIGGTRYQTAGRALTLLACLIMPLNLWFYHAQGLHPFLLYEQLWVAALVCCALYAASAWLLRDPLFVHVLVGGISLSSLLILANVDGPAEFWQITHPAILLTVLGLIALHMERAFPPAEEGAFTRKRFGLAFFWSGHVVLAAGLLLVLGAQLFGYFYNLYPAQLEAWGLQQPAPITSELSLKLLALILVLAGTYAYFYSDLVVRRIGIYVYLGVLTLLWAELLAIDLLRIPLTEELAIVVLALTALGANLVQSLAARGGSEAAGEAFGSLAVLRRPLTHVGQVLGLFLSTLPVLLGVWLEVATLNHTHAITWAYVGAMLVTAVSCRIGAHLYRQTQPKLSALYFFGTAAATLLGAAGLLSVLGLKTWETQAPLLMLLPIIYLVAARLYRGHTPEQPLVWVGHAATLIMLGSSLLAAFQGFLLVRGAVLNLALAAFFVEAAVFYALAAAFGKQQINVYMCTAMACGAVWQLLSYGQLDDVYYTLTFALVGMLLLVGYRFTVLERFQVTGLAGTAFRCANALLSLSFVAGALLTLSRLAANPEQAQPDLVLLLLALVVVSLLAVGLVQPPPWRRWYLVTTVAECVLTVLAVCISLSMNQKLEITSIVLGVGLLILGHIGWYREQDRHSDLVSCSLLLGSLLVAVPLSIAVVTYRYLGQFHWPDELGLLAAGILLFATGFMFRLRSTTLAGAAQLVLYVFTLLIYLPWSQWVANMAAIFLMAGGGAIFLVGLLLSVYRDRLLALPEQIKRRDGLFRVLSWR
jgi:hypothetical protein